MRFILIMRNMKIKNLFIITILFLLFSCQKNERITEKKFNQEEVTPMNQIVSAQEYDSLYIEATKKGNCDAFFELYKDAMEYADKSPILEFSKKTINVNPNCYNAQSVYFDALCRKYGIIDHYELAGRDIRKMEKQDYHEAVKVLKQMFKDKIITKSEFDSVIK